jgi:hypothetical protein
MHHQIACTTLNTAHVPDHIPHLFCILGAAIYELRFHPCAPSLLRSGARDQSIRLWNVLTRECIGIFGGASGHLDAVLSVDFHPSGDLFASSGVDGTIKVWRLDSPQLRPRIEHARALEDETPPDAAPGPAMLRGGALPLVVQSPWCTVSKGHQCKHTGSSFWVDNVVWMQDGTALLSRGVDERAVLWRLPLEFPPAETVSETAVEMVVGDKQGRVAHANGEGAQECAKSASGARQRKMLDEATVPVTAVAQTRMAQSNLWFLRFRSDHARRLFAMGNQEGQVSVWSVDKGLRRPLAHLTLPTRRKRSRRFGRAVPSTVRYTSISRDGRFCVCCCDDGSFTVAELPV